MAKLYDEDAWVINRLRRDGANMAVLNVAQSALDLGIDAERVYNVADNRGIEGLTQLIKRHNAYDVGSGRRSEGFDGSRIEAILERQNERIERLAQRHADPVAAYHDAYRQAPQGNQNAGLLLYLLQRAAAQQQMAAPPPPPPLVDNAYVDDSMKTVIPLATAAPAAAGATSCDSGLLGYKVFRARLFIESGGILSSVSQVAVDSQPIPFSPSGVSLPGALLDPDTFHQGSLFAGDIEARAQATATATGAGTWFLYAHGIPAISPRAVQFSRGCGPCAGNGLQMNGGPIGLQAPGLGWLAPSSSPVPMPTFTPAMIQDLVSRDPQLQQIMRMM